MRLYIVAVLIGTALTAGSQSSAAEPSKERSSAEKERSSAEKERSSAEKGRSSAEKGRRSAEKERRAAADAEFDQAKMRASKVT